MGKVRVRFAPSPTGSLHVGNARTALFNWLFARHERGSFILRIEDTDVERSEARYEAALIDDLGWFGLEWDEGPDRGGPFAPYRQSERRDTYRRHAVQLIDQGHAYFCFCSPDELEAERQAALKAGRQPRYSGRCRARPREESARKVAEGQPAAVRLKIVPEEDLAWEDLVHGPTRFASDVIGDFILVRSDGHPAYNFAVVIDDHLMEISHVIRGDDHISNTPRQLAVYQALAWEPPLFAHLSTILGPDRTRLSKRHGATSLASFREMGIVPEALRNYLLLLGWSAPDGKTEKLSAEEMIAQFSLDRVNKSPAVFDPLKLEWLNRQYLGEASEEAKLGYFRDRVRAFLMGENYLSEDEFDRHLAWIDQVILTVIADRADRLQVQDVFRLICDYDASRIAGGDDIRAVLEDAGSVEVLRAFIPKILALPEVTYERFREAARSVQKESGRKGKELFHPIRVAVTGAASGPELEKLIPIFEEGARLPLSRPIKSVAERLREFARVAGIAL
jgi:nondiscriminating glutamyl-tRNA synthetase